MKKSFRIIVSLMFFLAFALLGVYLTSSPDAFAFANEHGIGGVYTFLFGNQAVGILIASGPALTIQFSKNIEQLPEAKISFMDMSVDESQYVNGEKVVRPVAGAFPKVVTDPKVFPLKIEQKDDDQTEYSIKLHATLPQRISDWQELQQSYPSRQGILNRHVAALRQKIAREILFDWSPSASASIIETSGASKVAGLTKFGATGNRKKITREDILDAIQLITELDFDENLHMLIPASLKRDIRSIAEFVSYDKIGIPAGYTRSAIGEIEGVMVHVRSTGLIYDDSKAPQRVTTDETTNLINVDADACQGILLWNSDSVFKALGKMTPYIDAKTGALLGGSVNFSQAAGGNIRKDGLGVVAIVEKTA